MATHAENCMRYTLDKLYGLYGHSLLDDEYCPSSSIVTILVQELSKPFFKLSALVDTLFPVLDELGTGEEKWSLIKLLVGEEVALTISEHLPTTEEETHCSIFFIYCFKTQVLKCTNLGISKLFEYYGFLQTHANDWLVSEDDTLMLNEALLVRSVIDRTNLDQLAMISKSEWLTFNLITRQNPSFYHFCRMNVPLDSIMACYVNPGFIGVILNQCTSPFQFLAYLSFINRAQFIAILKAEPKILLSTSTEKFGNFLCFMVNVNSKVIPDLLINFPKPYQPLYELKTVEGFSPFHILAKIDSDALFLFLSQSNMEDSCQILDIRDSSSKISVLLIMAHYNAESLVNTILRFPEILLPMTDEKRSIFGILEKKQSLFLRLLSELSLANAQIILNTNKTEDGPTFACHFADCFPDFLLDVMLSRTDIRNHINDKALHVLTLKHTVKLSHTLSKMCEDHVVFILKQTSDIGETVGFVFAKANHRLFIEIALRLKNSKSDGLEEMCSIANIDGQTPFHYLAQNNGAALLDLFSYYSEHEVVKVLALTTSITNISVAYSLASFQRSSFFSHVQNIPQHKRGIFLHDPMFFCNGWSVCDKFAKSDGKSFLHLMTLLTGKDVCEVLKIKNTTLDHTTVLTSLVRSNTSVFYDLFSFFSVPSQIFALCENNLDMSPFHFLALNKLPAFSIFLQKLTFDLLLQVLRFSNQGKEDYIAITLVMLDDAREFINVVNKLPVNMLNDLYNLWCTDGRSLWHLIIEKQSRYFFSLIIKLSCCDAFFLLSLQHKKTGHTVAYDLAVINYRCFIDIFLHYNTPIHISSCRASTNVHGLVDLYNIDGRNIFDYLASSKGMWFFNLLQSCTPEQACMLMQSISNIRTKCYLVFVLLAHFPDIFLKIVLSIPRIRPFLLSMRNENNETVYHSLVRMHGQSMLVVFFSKLEEQSRVSTLDANDIQNLLGMRATGGQFQFFLVSIVVLCLAAVMYIFMVDRA